ncbi:hypothetical protein GCM10027563_03370 [Parasphingorhabdus pacifica]
MTVGAFGGIRRTRPESGSEVLPVTVRVGWVGVPHRERPWPLESKVPGVD